MQRPMPEAAGAKPLPDNAMVVSKLGGGSTSGASSVGGGSSGGGGGGEKSFDVLMKEVHSRIPPGIMQSMLSYVVENDKPELMGMKQQSDFFNRTFYVALYKDLYSVGYDKLLRETKPWLAVSKDSLMNNQQRVRQALARWGKSKCPIGNSSTWKAIAASAQAKPVFGAHLTLNSCDFRRSGKRRASRKARDWSYSLNAPGIRVQCLADMHGRIRWLSDAYSPKVQDEDFLKIKRDWFEVKFRNTVIAASRDYAVGRKFKGVKFLVPDVPEPVKEEPRTPAPADPLGSAAPVPPAVPAAPVPPQHHPHPPSAHAPMPVPSPLPTAPLPHKPEAEFNDALIHALEDPGRHPLALAKDTWKALHCFWEDEDQHEFLLWVAAGVHNMRINMQVDATIMQSNLKMDIGSAPPPSS